MNKAKVQRPLKNRGNRMLIDFAIITATEIDRSAVCKVFGIGHKNRIRKEKRIYWRGKLPLKDDECYEIVVAQSPDIVNKDAAMLALDTIRDWNPGAMIMVGIACAVSNEIALGDIILVQSVHYYEHGKISAHGKELETMIYNGHAGLWSNVITLPGSAAPSCKRPDGKRNRPGILIGIIIAGEKNIVDEIVRDQNVQGNQKTIAIETENYGLNGTFWKNFNQLPSLVIRAIANHLEGSIHKDWELYAAKVAAGFAKNFLIDRPLEPKNQLEKHGPINQNSRSRQQWDVFISYSRHDETIADEIQNALEMKNIRVWRDKDQIIPGDLFVKKIEEGLEKSTTIAVLVSPNSIKSNWVEEEYCRAIIKNREPGNPIRLIPILVDGVKSPPGFLASRVWVDFNDKSEFNRNIDSLINGIECRKAPTQFLPLRNTSEQQYLNQLKFLSFFPEGIIVCVHDHLISKLKAQDAFDWAFTKDIIEKKKVRGVQMIAPNLTKIHELESYFQDEEEKLKVIGDLLALLDNYVEREAIFKINYELELGIGRAILLRDLIFLVEGSKYTDKTVEERKRVCKLARENLKQIIKEAYYRLAVEISNALFNIVDIQSSIDKLTHASLLLKIGKALQAAELFDIWLGDNLFAGLGLTELERITLALDWAKASKDAGRAHQMHMEIINVYEKILTTLDELISSSPDGDSNLRCLKADVLNNRGTEIALFGKAAEWAEVQKDLYEAANIYKEIEDYQRFLACRANLVALTLERSDQNASVPDLLHSLEELDQLVSNCKPSEDLFFFYYQKGRLLKRLNAVKAISSYKLAQGIAEQYGLPHRAPIAGRWILYLRKQINEIGENDYLEGLNNCINSLKHYTEDRWVVNTLHDILLETAQIYRIQNKLLKAFQTLVSAFKELTRQFMLSRSEMAHRKFRDIFRLMDNLNIEKSHRKQFIQDNSRILKKILGIKEWLSVEWDNIKNFNKFGGS